MISGMFGLLSWPMGSPVAKGSAPSDLEREREAMLFHNPMAFDTLLRAAVQLHPQRGSDFVCRLPLGFYEVLRRRAFREEHAPNARDSGQLRPGAVEKLPLAGSAASATDWSSAFVASPMTASVSIYVSRPFEKYDLSTEYSISKPMEALGEIAT